MWLQVAMRDAFAANQLIVDWRNGARRSFGYDSFNFAAADRLEQSQKSGFPRVKRHSERGKLLNVKEMLRDH
jgi:hypothetical protein